MRIPLSEKELGIVLLGSLYTSPRFIPMYLVWYDYKKYPDRYLQNSDGSVKILEYSEFKLLT